jgi:hypothetical protein
VESFCVEGKRTFIVETNEFILSFPRIVITSILASFKSWFVRGQALISAEASRHHFLRLDQEVSACANAIGDERCLVGLRRSIRATRGTLANDGEGAGFGFGYRDEEMKWWKRMSTCGRVNPRKGGLAQFPP